MQHEEKYFIILRTNEFIREKTVHFTGDMSAAYETEQAQLQSLVTEL